MRNADAGPNNKRVRSLLAYVLATPPHYLLLGTFLAGFGLAAASMILGIDNLMAPAMAPYTAAPYLSRNVGYLAAPNWSLTYTFLWPLSVYFLAYSLRRFAGALDNLDAKGMVRLGADLAPVQHRSLKARWLTGTAGRTRFLFIIGFLVPVVKSLGEWYSHNLLRLFGGGPAATYPDYDWGLAGLMQAHGTTWFLSANAVFDLYSFCCEGVLLGVTFSFFLYLLDLWRVLPNDDEPGKAKLIPNLKSLDPRRGFEVFQDPLQGMLIVALLSYLMCYFIRINREYMYGANAASLLDFVTADILQLVPHAFSLDLRETAGVLLSTGNASYQAFLAGTVSFLIFTFSIAAVSITIYSAAKEARRNVLAYYENRDAPSLFGLDRDQEQRLAESMQTWPLSAKYLSLNSLLTLVALALLALLWYRIGLYVFAVVLLTVLTRIAGRLRKWGKEG